MNSQQVYKLETLFFNVYSKVPSNKKLFKELVQLIELRAKQRSESLKLEDQYPLWHQDNGIAAMTLYIDLFSTDFKSILGKIDYFVALGINLIHFMPLAKARPGNSDGGYAVMDYRDTDPRLGTWDDFMQLIRALSNQKIASAIDFVVNHTAKEHEWAQKAASGDPTYQNYYIMYDTSEIPDEFNRTVPEVLPDIYPGNFTYYESFKKYVFTSFSEFQWDLNLANPKVLIEVIDIFLFYANSGIKMVRFDAIPFIWKELGTTCRNLPTAHRLMEIFAAVKDIVCPSVLILGEAIVEPEEIFKYFGNAERPETQVLYNANLMVNVWNSLATQDTRLMRYDNARFVPPSHAVWINYLRCHDDIGWGFSESYIRELGMDPFLHKQFLINFYNGSYPASYARGHNYQYNPITKDARTNGTMSALIGFEKSMEAHDGRGLELAWRRFQLINSFLFSQSGIPLIYSGDEWLQPNDYEHTKNVSKTDGRWIHRPIFDWHLVSSAVDGYPLKAYRFIEKLIRLRRANKAFASRALSEIHDVMNNHVYIQSRSLDNEQVLTVFNFSENPQYLPVTSIFNKDSTWYDLLEGRIIKSSDSIFRLAAYEALYLVEKK